MAIQKGKSKGILKGGNVNPNIQVKPLQVGEQNKEKYKCTACDREWGSQSTHFSRSSSPIYYANNGYINLCNECRDKYYYQLVDFFNGDESKAIERMCQIFDWYYSEDVLNVLKKPTGNKSKLTMYLAKKNLQQFKKNGYGETYLDTIKIKDMEEYEQSQIDEKNRLEEEEEKKISEQSLIADVEVTPKMIRFWGVGYDNDVYITLQGYYDNYLQTCADKPDLKKQKIMKTLCLMEYQMQCSLQKGKDIGTLTKSYKDLLESSGIQIEDADTSDDTFGKWISDIEKYCPAEYYKDKTKYHDFFGIVEYIERFMYRPLRNLLFGTKEKEKEFWINDDEESTTSDEKDGE